MTNESIKSLRNLFLSSLAVLLLWVTSWPVLTEALGESQARYEQTRLNLHAWLVLKQEVTPELFRVKRAKRHPLDDVDERCVQKYDRGGGDWKECESIEIRLSWPTSADYMLELQLLTPFGPLAERGGRYRVILEPTSGSPSPATTDSLMNYHVIYISELDQVAVVPNLMPKIPESAQHSNRALESQVVGFDEPHDWPDLKARLSRLGFVGRASDLDLGMAVVEKLRNQPNARDKSVRIYGVQLAFGLFFASPGIFLGAIAFAMLGPLRLLKRLEVAETDLPWVLVTPTEGAIWLEAPVFLVTLGWALSPLAILTAQLTSRVTLIETESVALVIGSIGLIGASTMFLWASIALSRIRRHSKSG